MEKNGSGAAPTGCYKCHRPGHWSRDCPSQPNTNDDNNPAPPFNSSKTTSSYQPKPPVSKTFSIQKPKEKAPRRTRPKLTPELLLSNGGLGHILRYFPSHFKCRGRGHEVDDLRHLLGLYAEWNSRLLPYYNFEQFTHKVEQVGSSKRVKVCLRELQDKIASGADPTKLHESEVQQNTSHDQDAQVDLEMPDQEIQNEVTETFQEDMLQIFLEEATKDGLAGDKDVSNKTPDNASEGSNKVQTSEEDRRMKARQIGIAKGRIILLNP